ncbi:MAG TPA: cytochrome P450 [Jatrophihabitantaceae bacterium]|jgi:cytochrome P450
MSIADSSTDEAAVAAPVVTHRELFTTEMRPPGSFFALMDRWRDSGPVHRGDASGNPFHLVTGMADIRAACQRPEVFSNTAIQVDNPNPEYQLIPEMLDPPEHGKWRKLLGPLFSPGAVDAMEAGIRSRFTEILDEVADRGQCDYVAEVALRFPNTIFLELMGMPVAHAEQFQRWETAMVHAPDTTAESFMAAVNEVTQYFAELVAERFRNPGDDLVSRATTWTIDGAPITEQDLLSFCLLMFQAGLDTVSAQLSYAMYHLATHPADRARIVADPSLIPAANEEFLRFYSIVAPSRKALQDSEVGGCPVKKGEMVLLPLSAANRDPAEFDRADEVLIDRSANRHLAFGAGPHRCLGSHLARLELDVAMRLWHERIPEYRIDPDVPIDEHAGGLVGLNNLPLRWDI